MTQMAKRQRAQACRKSAEEWLDEHRPWYWPPPTRKERRAIMRMTDAERDAYYDTSVGDEWSEAEFERILAHRQHELDRDVDHP